jgi:curli biogenesis system outer membrane secretion channel CsgG
MKKIIYTLFLIAILTLPSFSQKIKGTIAVESFKLQAVSPKTQAFVSSHYPQSIAPLGDSFAALFTDKLRKEGFTVVTRKNIDTLMQENQLGQTGASDDEGTVKLKSADYRIIGTIRQFEEGQKKNGALAIVGVVAGQEVKQVQASVEVVIEMIARDGTVIASSTGKASKDGQISSTSGAGALVKNRVIGIFSQSTKGFESDAISNASNAALKDLSKQVKRLNIEEPTKTTAIENNTTYNLNKIRTVVSFPDSMVAEEIFINTLSDSNAKVIIGGTFDKNRAQNNEFFAEYCRNLARTSGAKLFIYGVIDSTNINQNSTRVSMSVRAVNLSPFEIIYTDSTQAAVIDVSNKAGHDRAVKEASQKLINRAISKIATSLSKIEDEESEDQTYVMNISGFQSLSSANRFLALLKKNTSVIKSEIIDFSGQTLFAEITVDKKIKDLAGLLERDNNVSEMFSVVISSTNDKKIIGSVVVR